MLPSYVMKYLNKLQIQYDRKKLTFGLALHDDGFILCDDLSIPLVHIKYIISCNIRLLHIITKYTKIGLCQRYERMIYAIRQPHCYLKKTSIIKYVSRQLRHSNTVITQNLYQHVTASMANKTANAMDEIFMQNNERKAK